MHTEDALARALDGVEGLTERDGKAWAPYVLARLAEQGYVVVRDPKSDEPDEDAAK